MCGEEVLVAVDRIYIEQLEKGRIRSEKEILGSCKI
jgi:hypothetical protein